MSYRCGVYEPLASMLGVEPGPPRVTCDGCGERIVIRENRMPPRWLLDGKPPPGWRTRKNNDGTRTDWCKACKPTALPASARSEG